MSKKSISSDVKILSRTELVTSVFPSNAFEITTAIKYFLRFECFKFFYIKVKFISIFNNIEK